MSSGKYAENLGAPDIKLEGLQIWIHCRQFPNEEDYWDGNWLNITAHCGTHGADIWASGAILNVPDIARWLAALEEMNKSLSGEANLFSLEPELYVGLSMKKFGQISMRVEITPDHMTQEHSFQFEIDQSYLPGLIQSCCKVLAEYPIKGKLDASGKA
uniref:WapI family immunity protein n=1 Tax=Trichocoleus desertorum TaxID=1481672 RepID=UPI0025B3B1E5|nr:hypothetical protein [Trichocoleus desertorum]